MEKQEILNGLNDVCNSINDFNSKCRKYGIGHNYYKECSKKLRDTIKRFLITLDKNFDHKIDLLDQVSEKLKKYSEENSPQISEGKEIVSFIEDKLIELEFDMNEVCNPVKSESDGLIVKYISGKKGWTDRNNKFAEFLKKLKGEIIIVDSYYGLGSFHVLDNFPEDKRVRFLTAQIGREENQDKINKELQRFRREFPKIELKKYNNFWELHDRYILSEDMLIWIGHGIKDFGDKECFLIGISSKRVLEIVKNLRSEFEERWKKSNNLT